MPINPLGSLVIILLLASCSTGNPSCEIKTSMGTITVELYQKQAPVTVSNFLKYVDASLYDSSSFFRVCTPQNESTRAVKIEVIQGGNVPDKKRFAPIPMETTQKTGLMHEEGTLSMARDQPNTATCEFFICINAQPELNYAGKRNPDGQGFAAFGKVTQGMDVVRKIQSQKDSAQHLLEPVTIYSIKRR